MYDSRTLLAPTIAQDNCSEPLPSNSQDDMNRNSSSHISVPTRDVQINNVDKLNKNFSDVLDLIQLFKMEVFDRARLMHTEFNRFKNDGLNPTEELLKNKENVDFLIAVIKILTISLDSNILCSSKRFHANEVIRYTLTFLYKVSKSTALAHVIEPPSLKEVSMRGSAYLYVENESEESKEFLFLIDPEAPRNFIREKVLEELGKSYIPCKIDYMEQSKLLGEAVITIMSRFEENREKLSIESCVVVKEIGLSLPTWCEFIKIEELERLMNEDRFYLQLANSRYDESLELDGVLGKDFVSRIFVNVEKIPIKDGLYLIPSPFGLVLDGTFYVK